MGNGCCTVSRRNHYIPDTEIVLGHGVGIDIPVVCQVSVRPVKTATAGARTEFAHQRCLHGIRCPFPVRDVAVRLRNQAEGFVALGTSQSRAGGNRRDQRRRKRKIKESELQFTLLNLSRPPSLFWMSLAHFLTKLYRCFSTSRWGSSHGSSWRTPATGQWAEAPFVGKDDRPVPSVGKSEVILGESELRREEEKGR